MNSRTLTAKIGPSILNADLSNLRFECEKLLLDCATFALIAFDCTCQKQSASILFRKCKGFLERKRFYENHILAAILGAWHNCNILFVHLLPPPCIQNDLELRLKGQTGKYHTNLNLTT